jgi:hypothetical protein
MRDLLEAAELTVGTAERETGIVLGKRDRARLVRAVEAMLWQISALRSATKPPRDPWVALRRRWHRMAGMDWWGQLPASTRQMLTGLEPEGRDSVVRFARAGTLAPGPCLVARWRRGLADLVPSAVPGLTTSLALRRRRQARYVRRRLRGVDG